MIDLISKKERNIDRNTSNFACDYDDPNPIWYLNTMQ